VGGPQPEDTGADCTADGQLPAWGDYGDNLVCGLKCGWVLAVRLVASIGMTREQIREALPPPWRPATEAGPVRHNHPTRAILALGLCPACDLTIAAQEAKREAKKSRSRTPRSDEPAEQLHHECLDCDALPLTHRAGRTHCSCGGDWPCPTFNDSQVRSYGRGTCSCCGMRRRISGHPHREVCSMCRAQGRDGWSFQRQREYRASHRGSS
jgi:hypothetical protein